MCRDFAGRLFICVKIKVMLSLQNERSKFEVFIMQVQLVMIEVLEF